jgi:glutaryl-CoA dehydrogenase (non-decarboxylating)
LIDFSLSDEHKDLARTVRDYAAKRFAPHIREWDSKASPDPAVIKRLAELGVAGVCFPERYGGLGMDYIAVGLVSEELEYVDTSLRVLVSIHVGLSGCGIYQWGTEAQRQAFLPRLCAGELGCFGLTEPDAGSDVAGIKTTARRDGESYVLNGSKIWISGASFGSLYLTFAKTDQSAGGKGLTAFIVDRAEAGPGFEAFSIHDKAGIRAGETGGYALHDVRVPAANRLGEEGEGFAIAMSCLDNGRYTVGAGATGLIRACLDASVSYAQSRQAFGMPIGKQQLVQQMIARMVAGYETNRLLYLRVGWMKNQGLRNSKETSLMKWLACDASFEAASDALQVHGAYGYSDEYPVARFLRNSKGAVIYEGTREIHTIMQGEYALGYRQDRPWRCELPPFEAAPPAPAAQRDRAAASVS